MKKGTKTNKPRKRKAIPLGVKIEVLTEAGYRCAACRGILAMELHHMVEVSKGGGDLAENLLALCPNCHSLYHSGAIHRDSIYAWKALLVALTRAYDWNALDHLIFLSKKEAAVLRVSGDGVLPFARLVAAGLATFEQTVKNGPLLLYAISLTARGKQLVSIWESGNTAFLLSTNLLLLLDSPALPADVLPLAKVKTGKIQGRKFVLVVGCVKRFSRKMVSKNRWLRP